MSAKKTYGFSSIVGGVEGALDNFPQAALKDQDRAMVLFDSKVSFYEYQAASTDAENNPYVITPDDHTGPGRWHLVSLLAVDMASKAILDAHIDLTTAAHGGIVANTDPRLTDQRHPLGHNATHGANSNDPITPELVGAEPTIDRNSAFNRNFADDTQAVDTISDDVVMSPWTTAIAITALAPEPTFADDTQAIDTVSDNVVMSPRTTAIAITTLAPEPTFATEEEATSGTLNNVVMSPSTTKASVDTHGNLTTTAHGGIVSDSDARLTDARTPTAHTHVGSDVTSEVANAATAANCSRTVTAGDMLAGGGTLTGDITLDLQHGESWQPRRVQHSTSNPSGGANGDVWLKY